MYEIDANLDGLETHTTQEQREAENSCKKLMKKYLGKPLNSLKLARNTHTKFLIKSLEVLPSKWTSLDSSRTWFVYWITNSLTCLDSLELNAIRPKVVSFIKACACGTGGYGGGPQQLPHLAATYAAMCALATVGGREAYESVDRKLMYKFIKSCKHPLGGFTMHVDGERDTRAGYCAAAVASLLGIVTDELFEDLPNFVKRSQNWEGGIGGEPGTEAHGGFTYCGLATVGILSDKPWEVLDLPALLDWTVHRQMGVEGGFQGRTNKLVDACYSWWCGSLSPMIHRMMCGWKLNLGEEDDIVVYDPPKNHCWYDAARLQMYILQCCQDVDDGGRGGIRDKPCKNADHYHCCYGMGGYAVSQKYPSGPWEGVWESSSLVVGNEETNRVESCPHLLFNVDSIKLQEMFNFWQNEDKHGRYFIAENNERGSVGRGALQGYWSGLVEGEQHSPDVEEL
eukprot:GDKJ01032389.1.p1 GENE.GDKJ01032389.1~~GDKJ01032389.1.p1  ORF type:complete len:454 (-),score=68.36 GDKJ01032389.1:54-1415(-)